MQTDQRGLEVEVGELHSALFGRRDEVDRATVVRNGYEPERGIPDQHRPGDGECAEGPRPRPQASEFSLGVGTGLRAQDREFGSGRYSGCI